MYIRGILYADDVVIFAKNHAQLQQIMFNLESFCFINDLAVNTNKSKVMLCGPVKDRNRFQIEYKRKILENVTNLKYLGVTVSNTGCYVTMFNPLIDRSMKAVGHLLSKSKDMVEGGLQVSTLCKLFTSIISPCLLYGSQIWGISPRIKLIKKVLVMFGRRILNVPENSSIIGVLGELGFFPLELSAKLNVVKYWYRLASIKAPPLAIDAYKLSMKLFHDDHHSWYKSLVCHVCPWLGASYVVP